MKNLLILTLLFLASCSGSLEEKKDKNQHSKAQHLPGSTIKKSDNKISKVATLYQPDFIRKLPFRSLPHSEITNFDNFDFNKLLSAEEKQQISLGKFPGCENLSTVKCELLYKLNFSDKFTSVVFTSMIADTELKTYLANYNADFKLIAFHEIAYDEIAEGCSRTETKINQKLIEVNRIYYCNQELGDTSEKTSFRISNDGEFMMR